MELLRVLSENLSPFSVRQNYKLVSYPCTPRPPGNITSWEEDILNFLSSVGAAAYFQIAPGSKQRKKLDSLYRSGLIYKYQLQGERNINIASSKPYGDLKELLKSLAFTQLVLTLKTTFPELQIIPGSNHIYANIILNQNSYPVIILRQDDNISALPFLINSLDRVIIVSESFYPEFNLIKIPARIAIDTDLLLNPKFYLPDGREEKAC